MSFKQFSQFKMNTIWSRESDFVIKLELYADDDDFIKFYFQNTTLSWAPTEPDFTFCFKHTALVYAPCGFLWLFSLLDFSRRRNSRYSHVPWSFLNVSKSIIIFLLICLMSFDLAMLISVGDETDIYNVQYVSVGLNIASFVRRLYNHCWTVV